MSIDANKHALGNTFHKLQHRISWLLNFTLYLHINVSSSNSTYCIRDSGKSFLRLDNAHWQLYSQKLYNAIYITLYLHYLLFMFEKHFFKSFLRISKIIFVFFDVSKQEIYIYVIFILLLIFSFHALSSLTMEANVCSGLQLCRGRKWFLHVHIGITYKLRSSKT